MNNNSQPILRPYPGGKGNVFQQIINLMPPHRTYIETHAGGGAVIRNKRPAELNIAIEIDPEVYFRICKILEYPYVKVYNIDALNYLRSFQPDEDTLIYADPPYLPSTRKSGKLYNHELSREQHIALIKQLRCLWPTKVMISGYWSELYEDMLHDWNSYSFESMTRGGMATEYIWFNFPWPTELHDYSHLGSTFRERERIKRRQNRWIANLKRMPALERNALLNRIREEVS